MVDIQYKSEKEKLYRKSFNPHVASNEEIKKDMKEQQKLLCDKYLDLSMLVDDNDLISKIMEKTRNPSPFDKKIIYDSNVKSVDNVYLYDFKDEKTFREVLKLYYCIIRLLYNYKTDAMVLKERNHGKN